jgi:hypothetical protein
MRERERERERDEVFAVAQIHAVGFWAMIMSTFKVKVNKQLNYEITHCNNPQKQSASVH